MNPKGNHIKGVVNLGFTRLATESIPGRSRTPASKTLMGSGLRAAQSQIDAAAKNVRPGSPPTAIGGLVGADGFREAIMVKINPSQAS